MNIFYRAFFFLLLVYSTSALGMERPDDEISLVVGNYRKEGTINPFAKQIFGDQIDLTHRRTFNGKAVTFDIEPCALPELSHIQGDATSYKFAGTPIKEIFWELFPPINLNARIEKGGKKSTKSSEEQFNNIMLMPNALRNLSRYMKEGAPLEIEHIPFISMADFKFYVQTVPYFKSHNPFSCWLSPFFMESIKARKHMGIDAKVAYWESVTKNKVSLAPSWNDEFAPTIVQQDILNHHVVYQAIQNLEALLPTNTQVQGRLDVEYNIYKSNPSNFLAKYFIGSISEMVAAEFSILGQQESIKFFLERNSFRDVVISRKDNPHNGRRNVWMISGVRNDQPIPLEDQ